MRASSREGRSPIWEWDRGTASRIWTVADPESRGRPTRMPLTGEELCLSAWRTNFTYASCFTSYLVSPPMSRERKRAGERERGGEGEGNTYSTPMSTISTQNIDDSILLSSELYI